MINKSIALDNWFSPHILALKPYSSARDEYSGSEGVFLDANENALGSATKELYNRYPDPHQKSLKQKIARVKGVQPEQIFLGNGSDEIIDLLIRATCVPAESHILTMPPTYGMYSVSASVSNIEVVPVPLTPDFEIDRESVLEKLASKPRLIFICNPNNPTGNLFSANSILKIVAASTNLVVVDEAYMDFAPGASMLKYLEEYPNLLIMQTFSKAWGMAGLRLGMAFAHPSVVGVLNKIKPPYNVNLLTQKLATEAMDNSDAVEHMVSAIIEERSRMTELLKKNPLVEKIYSSDTNFLLIKTIDAPGIYQALVDKQIIVRSRHKDLYCENCLRITIGSSQENRFLLEAMEEIALQSAF